MFAVESTLNGLGKRSHAKILGEHGSPGDRLKDDPMSAYRSEEGEQNEGMAHSSEHAKDCLPNGKNCQCF